MSGLAVLEQPPPPVSLPPVAVAGGPEDERHVLSVGKDYRVFGAVYRVAAIDEATRFTPLLGGVGLAFSWDTHQALMALEAGAMLRVRV